LTQRAATHRLSCDHKAADEHIILPQRSCRRWRTTDDDDYDDDDSRSYVRPLLQLKTVMSVLVMRPGKQFSFQITTERGYQMITCEVKYIT